MRTLRTQNSRAMETTRTTEEIEALLREIGEREDHGEGDPYPGQTYYQGIKAALEWMLGEVEDVEIL